MKKVLTFRHFPHLLMYPDGGGSLESSSYFIHLGLYSLYPVSGSLKGVVFTTGYKDLAVCLSCLLPLTCPPLPWDLPAFLLGPVFIFSPLLSFYFSHVSNIPGVLLSLGLRLLCSLCLECSSPNSELSSNVTWH